MLWALSDKSGLPAKRFAEFNPAPSLDWLFEAFCEERYGQSDPASFDVPARAEIDSSLRFSLICRPVAYDRAPRMQLVSVDAPHSQWDTVMEHLASWLLRHLNDPRLVIWIAERGGQLQDSWSSLIENKLDYLAGLARDGKTAELDAIRLHSPNAIPSPAMCTLWRLLLDGQVKSAWRNPTVYGWKLRLMREGLTPALSRGLREALAPKVLLKKPFRGYEEDAANINEPAQLKHLVSAELVLSANHVRASLRDLDGLKWARALLILLEDFQQRLRQSVGFAARVGRC